MSQASQFLQRLGHLTNYRLACCTALFFAVFFGVDSWITLAPAMFIVVGLLFGLDWIEREATWLLLTVAWGISLALNWLNTDNHRFLFVYLCLTLYLHASHANRNQSFAVAARLLIGVVFSVGVIQKAVNPDFRSGAFMQATLLLDQRAVSALSGIFGLDAISRRVNLERVTALVDARQPGTVSLETAPAVTFGAQALTIWTLVVETGIGVCFLVNILPLWRDALLLTFIISTYALIPITGFGIVLIALGLGQTLTARGYARVGYAFALLCLIVTTAL
jgi:hypothetical protein